MSIAIGDRLGRYEIVGPIGAGGMGEVWRAHDERLGRDVAIKVLPADFAVDPERLKRFEREARATAALSHPNILAVHDVGTHDGAPFLVEELLEGESLKERLDRGSLALGEAMRIAGEIAKGLAAAHDKGIVHRDLKPGNVFLTTDGTVKILDFGLARLVAGPSRLETGTEATTLAGSTQLGAVLGTVAYMAPEQARGLPVDQRADVFAFGVVLYEMLTGRRPFQGSTATDTLASILKDEPAPLPASVSAPLAAVVVRCLAKEPSQRYQDGNELRAAFDAVQSGAVLPAPWGLAARSRQQWLVTVAALATVAVALVALDVGGVRSRMLGGHGGPARSIRLAVLPFANLSGDPEQEYLSDGLTQEMIAQLGRLHPQSLSVIARTSVMHYKKSEAPIDQIGRELRVDYVLEGSAQQEAGRIRIAAELIQVRDQTQLWADVYERELAGILALQSDVAQKVAGALALKLLPAEQARLADVRSVNPEAHDAYLKGSYHWKKLTPTELDTAQRYFELALAKDPSYASAYEGLAWVWSARQQMGITPPREAGPKAKVAALQAVALDDASAEAHEALALVRTWTEWDWAGAEPEWKRALELDPNGATMHSYYAHFLAITGRSEEAIPHSQRALELDPFNALLHSLHAGVLNYLGRYEEAEAAARTALELQPDAPVGASQLEAALFGQGKRADHLALEREWAATDPELAAALEEGLAEAGYQGALRRVADLMTARYARRSDGVAAMDIAYYYLRSGDNDLVIHWLEKAYEDHDSNLPYIGRPCWAPLRSDPRFQQLLRRMNLPAE
jgi:TolB-like protein/Tfp pilus assembly protein PilF